MMNYESIDVLLDTVVGMDQVRSTTNTSTTDKLVGVSWYVFDGVVCEDVYIDRTNYVGFGVNTNHLGVCVRAGQIMSIYRQEGTIGVNEIKFLKFRVEGSTRSGYTSSSYTLTYEVFIVETKGIFLNVIKAPTSSSYIGTSTFKGSSISIGTSSTPKITFYSDSRGTIYDIVTIEAYPMRYLIEVAGVLYTEVDDVLVELDDQELSSYLFLNDGALRSPSGFLLMSVVNPKVIFWQSSEEHALPRLKAKVDAIPPAQNLYHNVDMNDATISGIDHVSSVFSGSPRVSFSKDAGVSWQSFDGTNWVDGTMYVYNAVALLDGDIFALWLQGQKNFDVKVTLSELDSLTDLKIWFTN